MLCFLVPTVALLCPQTVGCVLSAVDRANGYSFAASEVREIMKEQEQRAKSSEKSSSTAEQETEMRQRANNLFKIASDSEVGPSYHHTIEIMERYGSEAAADPMEPADEPEPSALRGGSPA